jgi:F-type H+-transporting ATPase subunit b
MATPSAHTEVPGTPHKPNFPPFNAATFPSQLLWLTVAFVILYVASAKLLLPRVASILEARRQRIAGDLAEAQRLKTESDAALAAYEKSLADARGRAQAVAQQRRERQNAEAETARKSLEQSLHGKLAEAEGAIANAKSAAMANVRAIATDAASSIVQRLIGVAPSSETASRAVGAVLDR